jgi:hypothetical protein
LSQLACFGTHHIFFPPGLQISPGQHHPNCFTPDAVHDAATAHLLGDESRAPACASLRRWPADQRHHRCLLAAVELVVRLWPRVFRQRVLQAAGEVSFSYSRNLARISAHRDRGPPHSVLAVEQQEHSDPPPDSRLQRLPASLHALQLGPVSRRQLQSREPLRFHSDA